MPSLDRDGVELFFEEAGSGAPPLVFIHSWAADHTYFAPQLEYFGRSHRAVAVDLRGHGASAKPHQNYTMPAFADDVAWLSRELDLERPVVVGHSLGGVVALQLAADHPDLSGAIVLLDAPLLSSEEFLSSVQPLIDAMKTPAYKEATRAFESQFIGFDDDPEQAERLLDDMCADEQHVMASALEHVFSADTADAAARCKVPVLYVSSGPWFVDLERFRELCPQVITGQTVGSGHFLQLEVPEQVNPMIERFITRLPSASV